MALASVLKVPMTELGFNFDIELSGWEAGLHGYRIYPDGTKEEVEGNLGIDLNALAGFSNDEKWLTQIPLNYKRQTKNFPEFEFFMLWLAANSTKAAQLLLNRPLLVALICRMNSVDKQRALDLCEMGQREILLALGFDNSKSVLRFLDKLRLNYDTDQDFLYIIKYLNPETRYYLRFKHYRFINEMAFRLDDRVPELTGTKLGRSLSETHNPYVWSQIGFINDAVNLGESLGVRNAKSRVSRLGSFAEVKALHDRWTERRIASEQIRPDNADMPYPVILDSVDSEFTQITHYDQLLKESQLQRHCIVSYHDRLMQGDYLVFQLTSPQRVTVGLTKTANQAGFPFGIEQIRARFNQPADETTLSKIYVWFEKLRRQYAEDVCV